MFEHMTEEQRDRFISNDRKIREMIGTEGWQMLEKEIEIYKEATIDRLVESVGTEKALEYKGELNAINKFINIPKDFIAPVEE